MAIQVTFSGGNKSINVNSGVTSLDVQTDLYSAWKHWVLEDDNHGWLGAFRTVGGDPTAAGQYSPKYFFLTNGWRVFVDGTLVPALEVALNLYVEEGGSPFSLSNNSTVSNTRSDVAVVEGVNQTVLNEILGLVQSNYHISSQVYDGDGNLTSASVKTYPTASDLAGDTNAIGTYTMTAVYTAGVLTDYKMIEA